jgi:hypothetical protein
MIASLAATGEGRENPVRGLGRVASTTETLMQTPTSSIGAGWWTCSGRPPGTDADDSSLNER